MSDHRLGPVGIWSTAWATALRSGDPARTAPLGDAAAELEALGYGTLWLGASPSVDEAAVLLDATTRVTVATGILSIWEHDPVAVARRHADLERRHPGRFLLGLGVSHPHLARGYGRPYAAMVDYLAALDAADPPVPAGRRVLAALGPRMLALAKDEAAGAHPYLVTEEHTAAARAVLGPGPLLAPELTAVVDGDRDRARATARGFLAGYLAMPNYAGNLRRLGFTDDDLRGGGSDRMVDALVALGDPAAVAARVAALRAAGADHVALQVVTGDRGALPRAQWREVAAALALSAPGR